DPGAPRSGSSRGTPRRGARPGRRSSGRPWSGRCPRPPRRPRPAGCRRRRSAPAPPRSGGRACAASAVTGPTPGSPLTWRSWYANFIIGQQSHEDSECQMSEQTTLAPVIRRAGEGEKRWFFGGGVWTWKLGGADGDIHLTEVEMVEG